MLDSFGFLGSGERSIIVQTRAGRNIDNVVEFEPDSRAHRRYRLVLDKYGSGWAKRKPATGVYNCAGHVWASRRTTLSRAAQWPLILQDDGYRRLRSDEPPLAGDLALYVDDENNDIIHVGLILEMRQGFTAETARIPWVLSKLDSTFGEVMHFVYDVTKFYADLGFRIRVEYWTDRAERQRQP
jgi:hypothetical protein